VAPKSKEEVLPVEEALAKLKEAEEEKMEADRILKETLKELRLDY